MKKVPKYFLWKLPTYTRYSWVADEEQKKKKILGITYGSLWVILLKGTMTFLISLKKAICKKSLGNPGLYVPSGRKPNLRISFKNSSVKSFSLKCFHF